VSKDEVKKNIWFFVFAISLAILTQIHFNAFFIILATTIVFLLIKRPRLNWKIWLGSLAIFTLIYSPLIINDIKLHGKNLHFFVDRLDKKESHPLTIIENVSQSLQYIASNNFLIISGINTIDTQKRLSHYGFSSDSKVMIWRILIFLFFLTEIFFLIKNLKNEKNETRKDFLILIGLWLFFSSAYLYQINKSYTIFPRFFLIVAPLSIILVGLIIEKIKPKANKKRLAIFLSIIFILVFSNALKIKNYFYQFSRVQIDDILVETEDVFPNTARVTLGQQNKITDYIYSKYNENKYPVYLIAKHEYEPIFWYHLEKREVFFRQIVKKTTIYKNGNYFLITFPNEDISKYSLRFDITEKKEFGALDVYFLEPKTEAIVPEQQKYPLKKSAQKKEIDKVMTWEKIFAKN